jgi:hypothetical protein
MDFRCCLNSCKVGSGGLLDGWRVPIWSALRRWACICYSFAIFFRVPFWLAVPALLAVPLIQAQASAVYVDLIANLGMATLIMATYSLYLRDKPAQPGLVAALLLGAFVAANSKMQLIPLAALALLFAAPPLTKWLARVIDSLKSPWEKALMLAVTLFTVMAIFFVPLKNLAQYGNPVYPMKIAVLGHTLNGPELSPPQARLAGVRWRTPGALQNGSIPSQNSVWARC